MDRKGRPEWKWKTRVIDRAAQMLREVLPESWLVTATFVPFLRQRPRGV
jgi:hypothetical protein